MKYFFSVLLSTCIIWAASAQNENIYFDSDKDVIRPNEIYKLEFILQEYEAGVSTIQLSGHCDTAGSDAYNLDLSKRRVNSVRDFLINRQILSTDIQMDYQGETLARKVAQEYRRVEITLVKKFGLLTTIPKDEIPQVSIKKEIVETIIPKEIPEKKVEPVITSFIKKEEQISYEDFMESIQPKEQKFTFTGEEEHILRGDQGTVIRVPENAFVDKNGEVVKGEITCKLIEYYSKKEFISEGLSTITQGNLLKSAGMIQLEAEANNKTIQMANGKDLEILFPPTEEKYSTYYGERDDEGNVNWKIDERYTRIQEDNLDNYGVSTTSDGKGLELVPKDRIEKRNKNAYFKGRKGQMRAITQEEVNEAKADLAFWEAKKKERTLLKSSQLGLINCDRIIDDENAKAVDFLVENTNKEVEAMSSFLILRNYNSIMKFYKDKNGGFYINARMPVGEKARMLITGVDKEGQFYMYEKMVTIAEKQDEKIVLEKSSYQAFDDLLKD